MYQKSLVKMPNMKINENPFSSSQVAAWRQRDKVKPKSAFLQLLIVNVEPG
jgi:hypothetical protein